VLWFVSSRVMFELWQSISQSLFDVYEWSGSRVNEHTLIWRLFITSSLLSVFV
jgi:hypothetical protein